MSRATYRLKLPLFRRRAGDARPEDLQALLARAPDRAPDPGDELPTIDAE